MRLSLNIYAMAYASGIYNPDGHVPYFQQPHDVLPFVKKVGLTSLELPLDYFFDRLDQDNFITFLDAAQDHGIAIFPAIENFDPSFLTTHLPQMTALGWTCIRIKMPHLGATFYGGNRHLSEHFTHSRTSFQTALDGIEDALADAGLMVAIENHQDLDAYDLVEICQSAQHGMRRITWDIGNSLSTRHTPAQFVDIAGEYISNIHLKDYKVISTNDGIALRRTVLGAGFIDPSETAQMINDLPACQHVSMELAAHPDRVCRIHDPSYHQHEHTTQDDAAIFNQFITQVAGQDHVGTGELMGDALTDAELAQAKASCEVMKRMFA